MKRYLLFLGIDFYPSGGMNDFMKDFSKLYLAEKYAAETKRSLIKDIGDSGYWFHIYDSVKGEIVKEEFFN